MTSKSARLITYFALFCIIWDGYIPLMAAAYISKNSSTNETNPQKINNDDKLLRIKPLDNITIAFSGDPILIPAQWDNPKPLNIIETGTIIPKTARVITPDKREMQATVRWLAVRLKYDLCNPVVACKNILNENQSVSTTTNNISHNNRIKSTVYNDNNPSIPSLWGKQFYYAEDYIEITPDQIKFFVNNNYWTILPFYLINSPENLNSGEMLIDNNIVNIHVYPKQKHDLGSYGDWLTGSGYTLPDMQSPLEAFRRTLLINESSINPNSNIPESKLLQAIARRNTSIILLGINTISQIPGLIPQKQLSKDLMDILTRTCRDGSTRFASWPAKSSELANLQKLLIDAALHASDNNQQEFNLIISTLKSWIVAQPHAIAWIESDAGNNIHLAIANLSSQVIQTTVKWHASNTFSSNIRINPETVSHITITRPNVDNDNNPSTSSDKFLQVNASTGNKWTFAIAPSSITIEPPGITIDNFFESWRLESWLAQRYCNVANPTQNNTRIILQRSPYPQSNWQIYIESLSRIKPKISGNDIANNLTENISGNISGNKVDKNIPPALSPLLGPGLAGYDALTIFVGPYNNPIAIVTISPDMPDSATKIKDWLGSYINPDSIKIKQLDNGWRALLTIPDEWIKSDTIDLGFIRTHNGTSQIHCYPNPCLPWNFDPGRFRYDLSKWQPMPSYNN